MQHCFGEGEDYHIYIFVQDWPMVFASHRHLFCPILVLYVYVDRFLTLRLAFSPFLRTKMSVRDSI